MEPKMSLPNPSPEIRGGYHRPELPTAPAEAVQQTTPEKAGSVETQPQSSGTPPAPSLAATQAPTLPVPQPINIPTTDPAADNNPLMASDEEVMEKEWVDRAKKIVAQTKDDPYTQEKEVSKLQADYLKKRYGKEIKLTDQ